MFLDVPTAGALGLDADWHVHSTFSDGQDTVARNVAVAERRGLRLLCLVDHVRADTDWVPAFVDAARRAGASSTIDVRCGVEAKMLDTLGEVDVPQDYALADRLLIADHQVPTPTGPAHPERVRELISRGELRAATAARWVVEASANALEAFPGSILAHAFSVFPKAGIPGDELTPELVDRLIRALLASGGSLEVSERWRCPGPTPVLRALAAGVDVIASTDSHRAEDIGRYRYCRTIDEALLELCPSGRRPSGA